MKIKSFFVSVVLGLNLFVFNVHAEDKAYVQLKPGKCVALRKGQVCYQRLQVSFSVPTEGNYCVHLGEQKTALKCWDNVSEGSFKYEFSATESVDFNLLELSGKPIANSPFTVAWVYSNRSRRRSAWRLF